MIRTVLITCMVLFTISSGFAAGLSKAEFDEWGKSVKVTSFKYDGVKELEPGVYTARWTNTQKEMIGVQLRPLSSFPGFLQPVKNKMPVLFTYKGLPAIYTDALGVGQAAIKYEKSDKVLMVTQIDPSGQTKAKSKDDLAKLLDTMKPELILK